MKESNVDHSNEKKEPGLRLSRFMANVSHDLKTPLNAVVGFSSLLVQGAESLPEDTSHQLGMIDKNARRLIHRLDAMVEFFRLRSGLIARTKNWLTPRELLTKICEDQNEALTRQENTLHLDKKSIPLRICAERILLTRIWSELITNAAKFTYNGKIEIGANLNPGSQAGLKRLDFTVLDTGNSLSQEGLAKLILSLGQSSEDEWLVKRTIFEGLGLGLALAREAANLMGGWITVEKQEHQGSKFCLAFELPENDIEQEFKV